MPAVKYHQKILEVSFLFLAAGVLAGGCNIVGALASKMPKPDIAASYKGLANQSVGVMVWVDRSTAIDWQNLQLDMATSIDAKLREAQKSSDELKGAQFPYEPRSYIKYLREHPGSSEMAITDLAPKFGVSRLIYVEINDFTSRVTGSDALYLGQMDATVKVIEVENGVAKVGFSESDIHVQYPPKATKDDVLGANDRLIYGNTVNDMSTELATRFFKHPDLTP